MKNEPVRSMTRGHLKEFIAALIGGIPDLSFDEAETIKADKGGMVAEVRQIMERRAGRGKEQQQPVPVPPQTKPQAPKFPPVPGINEPFELVIDGDLDITPLGWKPLGGPVFPKGKRIYRARLLDLDHCSSRSDAIRKIRNKANEFSLKLYAAPGLAREAFMAAYPRHNGRPIVMAGNMWQHPLLRRNSLRRVATLGSWDVAGAWYPYFDYSDRDFNARCLWLVIEQPA